MRDRQQAEPLQLSAARLDGDVVSWRDAGGSHRRTVLANAQGYLVLDGTRRHSLRHLPAFAQGGEQGQQADVLRAPMPGRIVAVKVQAGQQVAQDEELIVMEAMKMELTLRAPCAGSVAELHAADGQFVEADTLLVRLQAEQEAAA